MAYFTQDFFDFFLELEQNNHKKWFDENRKRYETNIKKPFADFIEEMIIRISADDPEINPDVKQAIFRINRDIRFSKDKRPYKTQVSAIISSAGRNDKSMPGFYLELKPSYIGVYGGAYMLATAQVANVRGYIADHLEEFASLKNDTNFVERFGEISGEKAKRLPKEFKEVVEAEPLIANKQFYFFCKLETKLLLEDSLSDKILDCYFAARPLVMFFRRALG